ncbi:MAG: hypothetical protein QNJ91_11415 [Gammaproteobacteria bacterium]|nr:hypothetical protein [Gammaproteobacteria bacterium]
MTRTGRYWLFFVIVAVGLALSWGQIGRKTERVLATQPVSYLQHEPGCDPWQAPCAAFGSDRAIVVGPGGDGLQVKTTGFTAGSVVAASGELLDADDRVVAEITFAPANPVWRLRVGDGEARRLRVRVRAVDQATVAEFPLLR